MTANELSYNVQMRFDSLFEYAAPAYDDYQMSQILSNAQRIVTEQLVDKFEQSEHIRRRLDQLIKSASVSNGDIALSSDQTEKHPNGYIYDMPAGFYLAVEEAAKLTGNTEETTVKPITHDEYRANVKNPYKKPYSGLVWRMDISRETDASGTTTAASAKRTELITDGTGITDYRVRYLRELPNIVVDTTTPANQRHCVLDASFHDAIIDEAVKLMRAAVTPETYQIGQVESQKNKL